MSHERPNNGMHPTPDTPDVMNINLVGGRVMPGVRLLGVAGGGRVRKRCGDSRRTCRVHSIRPATAWRAPPLRKRLLICSRLWMMTTATPTSFANRGHVPRLKERAALSKSVVWRRSGMAAPTRRSSADSATTPNTATTCYQEARFLVPTGWRNSRRRHGAPRPNVGGNSGVGRMRLWRGAQPNMRMHATRDTTAVKMLHRAGGHVMRGVRPIPSYDHLRAGSGNSRATL